MKVKFTKSHSSFAYFAGDTAEGLSESDVKELLQSGCVDPVKETPETANTPKVEITALKAKKK